jgi:hypothetical protein
MNQHRHLLKSGHEHQPQSELLGAGVTILAGVNDTQAKVLEMLGIRTVFDLAFSPAFKTAAELLAAAQDPRHPLARHGLLPAGQLDSGGTPQPPAELINSSPERLAGVNAAAAKELANACGITNLRDMALWPPYAAACTLGDLGLQPDPSDLPYTAPEIVPRFGEYATDIVYYPKLITISGPDDAAKDLDKPISLLGAAPAGGLKPYLGARLTFQQSWTPEAITLGRLLHSLSLAPGESTRMAVIDWSRQTRSSSQESVSQQESLQNSTQQNSSLQELTSAVASEAQSGSSSSASASASYTAAAAGAAWSPVAAGATAASSAINLSAATSVSASAGRRDMASDYGQQIDRSTEQASLSQRSKRAAMVTETSQSEHEELSTRVVVNYNHMHALNVLYFEVVQLYRVQLRLDKAERVLFVPMEELRFDEAVVQRFRSTLIACALGPEVRSWLQNPLGSVVASLQATSATHFASVMRALDTQPPSKAELLQRAKASAHASARIKALARSAAALTDALSNSNGDGTQWELNGDCKLLQVGWSNTAAAIEAVQIRTENGRSIELRSNAGLNVQSVTPARELAPGLAVSELESISLKLASVDKPLIQTVSLYFLSASGRVFTLPCDLVVPVKQTSVPLVQFASDLALNDLLRHLNENSLYYSQHIWRRLDSQTLGLLLAPFKFQGKRLIEYADTTPIAVNGRHLAFLFPDDEDVKWKDWLANRLGKPYLSQRLVALPTGGVFAEGVLGRSNCAEKIDLTRFWNWQDSPPPMQASDIAALQAGQHSVESAQRAGGLEAPVVNIMAPQALPDPTGVGAILGSLGNGSLFRDMSGLAGTQSLVSTGLQASSSLAGQSLSSVVGLAGAVAPLGASSAAGTLGGASSPARTPPAGLAGISSSGSGSGSDPASSVARGLERRLSPLTSTPTAVGGGINLAREIDRSAASTASTQSTQSAPVGASSSQAQDFFRTNFSSGAAGGAASAAPSAQFNSFLQSAQPLPVKDDAQTLRQGLPEDLRASTDSGVALQQLLAEHPGGAVARINELFLSELQPLLDQALSRDDKLEQALRLSLDLQGAHEQAGLTDNAPLQRAAPTLARAWRAALARCLRELGAGQLAALARLERLIGMAQTGLDEVLGLSSAETDLGAQLLSAGLRLTLEAKSSLSEVKAGQAVTITGVVSLALGTAAAKPVAAAKLRLHALQSLEQRVEVLSDGNGRFSATLTHDPNHLGSDSNGPRSPDLGLSVALLALHPDSDGLQAEALLKLPGALSSQLVSAVFDDDGSNALAGTVVVTQPNRLLRLSFRTSSAGVPVRLAPVQVSVNGSARVVQAATRTGDGDARGLSGVTVLPGAAGSGVSFVALITQLPDGRSVAARADLQGP